MLWVETEVLTGAYGSVILSPVHTICGRSSVHLSSERHNAPVFQMVMCKEPLMIFKVKTLQ